MDNLEGRKCLPKRISSLPNGGLWCNPTTTEHIDNQLTGPTVPQDEVLGNRALEPSYVRRQLMQRALPMCAGFRPVRRCRRGHGHELVIVRRIGSMLYMLSPLWIGCSCSSPRRRFSKKGFSVARLTNFRPGELEY